MENYFDKFKNEIIAGAESGFGGLERGESDELTNHYECEADSEEIDNISEVGTALYSDKIKEVAEGELVAGGEAAVARAAYRAKTMAKGGMKSVSNALNKLAGRTSNIDKTMTAVANKAKAAKKGLEKSGLPKDSEAKAEFPKDLGTYLENLTTFIKDCINGFSTVVSIGDKPTARDIGNIDISLIVKDASAAVGAKVVPTKARELKKETEDYSASDVMESIKDKYDSAIDATEEVSLSIQKTKLIALLEKIETEAKKVKTDKISNNLRKSANKLAGVVSKADIEGADNKTNAAEYAQQISSAVGTQIGVLTRVVKFTELSCDKVVTAARALEAKLPSGK